MALRRSLLVVTALTGSLVAGYAVLGVGGWLGGAELQSV